jgi:hypothetical protein
MAKNIMLVIPGAEGQAEGREAPIEPGTTAADLLRAANLDPDRWQLQLKRGDGFLSVSGHDDLHAQVNDGEKAYAVSREMVVGV